MPWSCRSFFVATVLISTAFSAAAQQGSLIRQAGAQRPGGGDPRDRPPATPDYRLYEYGKEVYAVKLGCSSCPLGGKPLDESLARQFLADQSLWAGLNSKEEDAVTTFLRQMFGL